MYVTRDGQSLVGVVVFVVIGVGICGEFKRFAIETEKSFNRIMTLFFRYIR